VSASVGGSCDLHLKATPFSRGGSSLPPFLFFLVLFLFIGKEFVKNIFNMYEIR
jgi:hypothetical protein